MAKRPREVRKEIRLGGGGQARQGRRIATRWEGKAPSSWSRVHCPCLAAACAAEWKGRSAAIGRQQETVRALGSARGPGRFQECTTACPARLSAPARRAHHSESRKAVRSALRARGAHAQRADRVTCCARAPRRPQTGARVRVRANACARTGRLV